MGLFSKRPPAAARPDTAAPRIAESYYSEILTTAGFPLTADNLAATRQMVGEMLLVKAWQFISSQNQHQADTFMRNHTQTGLATVASNQKILDDLVAWDRDVAPYIDDLPTRVRRILLESGKGSFLASPKDQSLLVFLQNRED